jgi:hypothetical protein
MAATGADDATASRVVAAMAADAGGAVLHGELALGLLPELPGRVLVPPALPDAARLAAAIRQLVAG